MLNGSRLAADALDISEYLGHNAGQHKQNIVARFFQTTADHITSHTHAT